MYMKKMFQPKHRSLQRAVEYEGLSVERKSLEDRGQRAKQRAEVQMVSDMEGKRLECSDLMKQTLDLALDPNQFPKDKEYMYIRGPMC
jgi:hypothetical protein